MDKFKKKIRLFWTGDLKIVWFSEDYRLSSQPKKALVLSFGTNNLSDTGIVRFTSNFRAK
jgi:hypothetical protein